MNGQVLRFLLSGMVIFYDSFVIHYYGSFVDSVESYSVRMSTGDDLYAGVMKFAVSSTICSADSHKTPTPVGASFLHLLAKNLCEALQNGQKRGILYSGCFCLSVRIAKQKRNTSKVYSGTAVKNAENRI